jgi:hypothetical protein
MRVLNLLDPPTALIAKLPELRAAAAAAAAPPPGRDPNAPRVKRPSREDLLAVVA